MKNIGKVMFAVFVTVVINVSCPYEAVAQTNAPTTANTAPAPTSGVTPNKPSVYGSSKIGNYLRTWSPRLPYKLVSDVISISRTSDQVNMKTEYSDAFARPIQTVDWQSSPTNKDIVSPRVYDQYGREQYKYAPYVSISYGGNFKTDPFGEQSNFFQTTYVADQPAYQGEQFYYGMTQFESSPLNRVLSKYDVGNSWVGSNRGTQTQYLLNNSNDLVRVWAIASNALTYTNNDITTNIPASASTYAAGTLTKKVTIDVNGNKVIEFVDKDELTVFKKSQVGAVTDTDPYTNWLCTYYIYDDLNRLRFVISPKAVALRVAAGSWTLSTDEINELCYRYEYDDRGRKIAQKAPGSGWIYTVYDKMDRPVFSQDANMRASNQWLGTIYDYQDRVIETGMLTYSSGPVSLQSYVDANTGKISLTGQAVTGSYLPSTLPVSISTAVRVSGTTQYLATSSITFLPGFTTEANASFVAQIAPNVNTAVATSSTMASDNTLPSGANFVALTMNYFDNYSATTKTYSTANNAKLDQGNNVYADPLPSTASKFTMGLATSLKVRVLENINDLTQGVWLETANFYDDKGRIVQTQSDNYKGGVDYKTNLYEFGGKVICTYMAHNNPAATTTVTVKTNTDYDHGGRLVSIRKTINDDNAKTRIIEYNQYDALGKLKVKKLGQKSDVNGNPIAITNPAADNTDWLEVDNYGYNIRGWLKGVNWNYSAGPTTSQVSIQNNKWFGIDLSYDWGFNSNRFDGNLSGQRWVSAGDGKERAYGYGFDPVSRLLKADFTQNFGSGASPVWTTADPANNNFVIDFTVKMGDGQNAGTAYDFNGNILQMQQKGLVLNTSQPIDNLTYTYENGQVSNKIRAVQDASGSTAKLGDFADNSTTSDDYGYDLNGNLITDANRRLNGTTGVDQSSGGAILYNYKNLPGQISVKNADGSAKGTITFIYDASGNKLEKRINELASSSNNNTAKNTVTSYLGDFVYNNNALQYFVQEDGRVRPSTNAQQPFVYDYFIKDHLSNTRVVLTDEQQQINFPVATVERTPASSLTTEEGNFTINESDIIQMSTVPSFSSAANNNYLNNNGNPPYNTNPNANTGAQSLYMYKLNGQSGDKTGLGITVKVMAGDRVDLWGKSYYHINGTITNSNSIATTGLNAFISAFAQTPVMAAGAHGATATTLQGSPVTPGELSNYLTTNIPTPTNYPKAYINWILFDEQFRPVKTGTNSGFLYVGNTPDAVQSLSGTATITTSGYLYVYCSNESNNDVYFDNIQVIQTRGPLLEETHYYPFGLTMAGISGKALKTNYVENKSRFQGQELQNNEFSDGSGLEMYEFKYRMDDPQIGRFWQTDPLTDKYVYNSPYAFSENKVTGNVELEGLESVEATLAQMWREWGITSSTDAKEFVVKDVGGAMLNPRVWLEGYAQGGQMAMPFVLTGIMTGGFGEGLIFETELSTLRMPMPRIGSSAFPLLSEPLGDQWGAAGLFSSEGRTTTLLGTSQGYWGTVTRGAANQEINLVANTANPGGFSYLSVNTNEFDFNEVFGRNGFFKTYNIPFLDAAIARGDRLLMLDNPYSRYAIYPGGDASLGFNFYGREVEYLQSKGFTFANGEAIYPSQQAGWHVPMVYPSAGGN
jgi:RHS repeat-associated protein